MPLPDETPRQSVANLIGRFEQQGQKRPSATASSATLPACTSSKSLSGASDIQVKKQETLEPPSEMPVPKKNGKETTPVKARTVPRQSATSPIRQTKTTTATTPVAAPKKTGSTVPRTEARSPQPKSTSVATPAVRAQHTGSSVVKGHGGAPRTTKSPPSSSQGAPAPAPATPRAKTPSASRSRLYAPTAASLARSTGPGDEPKPKTTTSTPARAPPKKITSPPTTSRTAPATNRPKTPSSTRKPPVTTTATTRKPPVPSTPATKSRTTPVSTTGARKILHTPRQSIDRHSASAISPHRAEIVADPDTSLADSDFAGNITHLSSQTHDAQEIENYDEDFPETETEENQVIPPEVSHVEETAAAEPATAEKAQEVEEIPGPEIVTEEEVHAEHQEIESEEVKQVAHEESVAETQEVSSEPSQSVAPEEHPTSEGEVAQERASQESPEENATESEKGAAENHEQESLVNDEVVEVEEQSNGEEAVGTVAVPEEEPTVVDAETPASSPEPEAQSAEEHPHPHPNTNVSSPDLDDAVRMLEGTSIPSHQPANESDDDAVHSPDEY